MTATVRAAAVMCAALTVEPIAAKSEAAAPIRSGEAITDDISVLPTGHHRLIGTIKASHEPVNVRSSQTTRSSTSRYRRSARHGFGIRETQRITTYFAGSPLVWAASHRRWVRPLLIGRRGGEAARPRTSDRPPGRSRAHSDHLPAPRKRPPCPAERRNLQARDAQGANDQHRRKRQLPQRGGQNRQREVAALGGQ